MLFSIDGYSASESLLPWMDVSDWAWKAVVAAASDVAASGGEPQGILYSVGLREPGDLEKIASGVGEAADWLGVVVLGGDTNRVGCDDSWIDVAVVGKPYSWIKRTGARPGMRIIQVGYVGYGSIAKLIIEGSVDITTVDEDIVTYTKRPKPPMAVGEILSKCGAAASIDNSDGWAWSLLQMALASGVGIELLEVHAPESVTRTLVEAGVDNVEYALLGSWEDYTVAAAVPEDRVGCVLRECNGSGIPCWDVGVVYEAGGELRFKGKKVDIRGWDSFSSHSSTAGFAR